MVCALFVSFGVLVVIDIFSMWWEWLHCNALCAWIVFYGGLNFIESLTFYFSFVCYL
jgi:hypothetical protein